MAGGVNVPDSVRQTWPEPNYENPETRGWGFPVFLIILLVIAIAVYTARMWARLRIARNAGWDDWLMSIAMLSVVGATISVLLGIISSIAMNLGSYLTIYRSPYIWLPMARLGPNTQNSIHCTTC